MITRSISHLMLGLSLAVFHQGTEATESTAKGECQEKVKELEQSTDKNHLPTLAEIRDVDPTKVPWGINLDLAMERGSRARKASVDACDFSSRITLYQKHKSVAKKLTEEYTSISAKIDAYAEKKTTKKDKEDLQKLQDEKTAVRNKMDNNNTILTNFATTIKNQMGLKPEQIAKLPDLDTWKAMKKGLPPQRPQTLPPSAGSQQVKSPPQRPQKLPPRAWQEGKVEK